MKIFPAFFPHRALAILCAALAIVQHDANAAALLDFHLDEGSGNTTVNSGQSGGIGVFSEQGGFPLFSTNIPSGPFAPGGNISSIDFGPIGGADGNRGIDFPSTTPAPTFGLSSFTVTGWINVRDSQIGAGGNRIISTWPGEMGRTRGGFEVVQVSDGRLRFSVNEAPDFPGPGPFSNDFRYTVDPATSVTNWVFFAITYDSGDPIDMFDGVVNYYFGNADTLATLDSTSFYDTGPVLNVAVGKTSTLTLGNFVVDVNARPATGAGSRVFRGLIDEIGFYEGALDESEIQAVQTVPEPTGAALLCVGLVSAGGLRRKRKV
jgi:hypothetical protein